MGGVGTEVEFPPAGHVHGPAHPVEFPAVLPRDDDVAAGNRNRIPGQAQVPQRFAHLLFEPLAFLQGSRPGLQASPEEQGRFVEDKTDAFSPSPASRGRESQGNEPGGGDD